MLEHEGIVEELEMRVSSVPDSPTVLRNPVKEPSVDDLPIITIIELTDTVDDVKHRGGVPLTYRRTMNVVVEVFVKGTTDALSSKELMAYVKEVKKKIYENPKRWYKLYAVLTERGYSRVLRPPTGDYVAGIGIQFEIQYHETLTT